MRSHANRGLPFENYIAFMNRHYKTSGAGIIEKQHTKFLPIRNGYGQVVNCKVDEKALCDYFGFFHGKPVAIEAKHVETESISFSAVEDHQATFLDDVMRCGGYAYVLVSFKLQRFFCIPWDFWKEAREDWRNKGKKAKPDRRLICFDYPIYKGDFGLAHKRFSGKTPGKASIRADEIPEEWRVNPGMYGLDYMGIFTKEWDD